MRMTEGVRYADGLRSDGWIESLVDMKIIKCGQDDRLSIHMYTTLTRRLEQRWQRAWK
jgi:hypothetical protein